MRIAPNPRSSRDYSRVAPIVIAHRTCPRDAPENSLAGIAAARAAGAEAVEVDVRRTRDGVPVLLHDKSLLRTARWPRRLDRCDSDWVRTRRLGGPAPLGLGLFARMTDETVPTFAEALEALGDDLHMAIDVKDPGAGDAVIAEVRNQGKDDQVLFWSKYEPNIRVAAATAPHLEIALLRDTSTAEQLDALLTDTAAFGARAISAHWSQVGPSLRKRCDDLGLTLYAWCKSEQIEADKLELLDGLVTDWPAIGRRDVDSLAARGDGEVSGHDGDAAQ